MQPNCEMVETRNMHWSNLNKLYVEEWERNPKKILKKNVENKYINNIQHECTISSQ